MDGLKKLSAQFQQELAATTTLAELQAVETKFLGKKSEIRSLLKELGGYDPGARKEAAERLNTLKTSMDEGVKAQKGLLVEEEVNEAIKSEWIDLSLPACTPERGARHPLSIIEKQCIDVLGEIGFEFVDGPEVETPFRNFDALNIPEHHPARDMQDTFWLEGNLLLRSHTSTVQVRTLEQAKGRVPIKIVSPGRVYRNEAVDATHLACFHQFEGMWVDKGIKFSHLKGVLDYIVGSIFDKSEWNVRVKPKFYPYTEPSVGVDVSAKDGGSGWITILGAGMVHPNVFRSLNYNPDEVSGFAFGLGVSRIAAQIHQIKNMKSLYESDLRVHRAIARKPFLSELKK